MKGISSPPPKNLGAYATRTQGTIYQAATDGFAIGLETTATARCRWLSDTFTPPTTERAGNKVQTGGQFEGSMIPVQKNHYYQGLSCGNLCAWIPNS